MLQKSRRQLIEEISGMIESGRYEVVMSGILDKIESGVIPIESVPFFFAVQKSNKTPDEE